MVQKKNEQTIKDLAKSVLQGTDFFLVDVEVKGSREPVVWIYVDAEKEGINMDQCADISQELGFLMDAHELFNGRYRLNVSSPGLSRPLTDRRQYPKNTGRKARVKFKINGNYEKLEGTLQKVDEKKVVLKTDEDETTSIAFDQIVETKIIPAL